MAKQVVLVTGCSSGLGRELCAELARQRGKGGEIRYKVYASARRQEQLEALTAQGVATLALDVSNSESAQAAVKQLLAAEGRLDLLICNAGIAATAPLVEQAMDDVDRIFQTNTLGVLRTIQAAAPAMIRQRAGRIVVVGSITAFLASPFNGAYAASKAAVHSMCETLAMELEPFGVHLTEVWAGTMRTDINAKVAADVSRYAQPDSAYHLIGGDIRERAEILEKSHAISPAKAAADIVRGIAGSKPRRYISTGSDVALFNMLGYLQCWLWPGGVAALLQDKFGLRKLKGLLAVEAASPAGR